MYGACGGRAGRTGQTPQRWGMELWWRHRLLQDGGAQLERGIVPAVSAAPLGAKTQVSRVAWTLSIKTMFYIQLRVRGLLRGQRAGPAPSAEVAVAFCCL